ncbi:unnamed protein product [Linum trigynum]|uniref:Uncharacterized protein n=1 Tax=Linum trigynum TaxID=586398 RepID=A0AAV2DJY8_9ROSI
MAPITTLFLCLCSCLDFLINNPSPPWLLQLHHHSSSSLSSSSSSDDDDQRRQVSPAAPLTLAAVGVGYVFPDVY